MSTSRMNTAIRIVEELAHDMVLNHEGSLLPNGIYQDQSKTKYTIEADKLYFKYFLQFSNMVNSSMIIEQQTIQPVKKRLVTRIGQLLGLL